MKKNILSFAFLFVAIVSMGIFWIPRPGKKPGRTMALPQAEIYAGKGLKFPPPAAGGAPAEKAPKIPPRVTKGPPKEAYPEIPKPSPPASAEEAPPKESSYAKAKKEVKEWLDILAKGIPVISLIMAWVVRRRKHEIH